jgi:hypothetical protein
MLFFLFVLSGQSVYLLAMENGQRGGGNTPQKTIKELLEGEPGVIYTSRSLKGMVDHVVKGTKERLYDLEERIGYHGNDETKQLYTGVRTLITAVKGLTKVSPQKKVVRTVTDKELCGEIVEHAQTILSLCSPLVEQSAQQDQEMAALEEASTALENFLDTHPDVFNQGRLEQCFHAMREKSASPASERTAVRTLFPPVSPSYKRRAREIVEKRKKNGLARAAQGTPPITNYFSPQKKELKKR